MVHFFSIIAFLFTFNKNTFLERSTIPYKHEFSLELKQKHFFSSIVLYIVSTVFVCYLSFSEIEKSVVWNGLFWVVMLFSLTNAISKSFINENSSKQLFIYSLINPRALIVGKIIYNLLLTSLLVVLIFLLFSMLIETDKKELNTGLFLTSCLLGGATLSSTLTMIGAIAAKTNNNIGVLAILAFPIVLPSLLLALQLTNLSFLGGDFSQASELIITLGSINILVIALALLLFPYLWKA